MKDGFMFLSVVFGLATLFTWVAVLADEASTRPAMVATALFLVCGFVGAAL